MKCWDIGGQAQYRSEWSRYSKGCDVVLYVVDAAAPQKMATAKKELHKLLDDGSIGSTPLLKTSCMSVQAGKAKESQEKNFLIR